VTYNADESSAYQGRPIELYKFEGTFLNYYYTSHNEDVIYQGQRYTAKPIRRSRVKVTTPQAGNSDLSIELPGDDPLVKAYGVGIAPPELTFELIRYHDPSDVVIYWRGNVTNIRINGNTGTLVAPNEITRFMSGEIPSVLYQTPCNNILGDGRCGVDIEGLKHTTFMYRYTKLTVTTQSDGGRADQFYRTGKLVTPYEQRSIVSHVGNTMTLAYPLTKQRYGMQVILYPGCNLKYDGDCLNKFNNQVNFGGFKFIPNVNPFVEGID
jgi:uncharacterized phage protein (TIGR02218 family)